jgi:hypothetical protein
MVDRDGASSFGTNSGGGGARIGTTNSGTNN